MRRHHSLRASDADRDAVVDRLRVAAGEGRLEPEELEQRVHRALRARTYGDLGALVADLPGGPRRHRRRRHPLVASAAVGAGVLTAATVAVVVVAVVAMMALAAAALWMAVVLCWVVVSLTRRRLACGPPGRRSVSARHSRRARPTF